MRTSISRKKTFNEIDKLKDKADYLQSEIKKHSGEYTEKDKIKRLNHQYRRLAGKINYMNRLTNMGRKFGRNMRCPCKSGKKFKHCCIKNHEYNSRKLSALQIAMTKLQDRVKRYGLRFGVEDGV